MTALIDPAGKVGGLAATLVGKQNGVTWPQQPSQARIGFLSNGKPNIASLFRQLSEMLGQEGAVTVCSLIKPGPTVPAGPERIGHLATSTTVVVVGVCDGGTATSWGIDDAVELVSRGIPVVLVCTSAFVRLAKNTLPGPIDGLRILEIPHPLSSLTDAETDALAAATAPRLRDILLPEGRGDVGRDAGVGGAAGGDAVSLTDGPAASMRLYERGWTDGLPAFVPTKERVTAFLREAGESAVFAAELLVPPRKGVATAEAVAANAIMAGMPPMLMPYLVAALEASCSETYNLFGVQTTTNPAATAVIVGGPHRRRYGFNDGLGAMGPGSLANATLGRAMRLCHQNLGGASARNGTDPATMGQPGKYIFCFAENEDASPWVPLRMQVKPGLSKADDSVTVLTATGTTNLIIKSRNGEEFMEMLAGSIRNIASNDYMFGGHPLLVLCPEHADVLGADGWTLERIQQRVFDTTKIRFGDFAPKNQEMTIAPRSHEFTTFDPDMMLPIVEKPTDFLICVAGGPSLHSTFIPSFGGGEPFAARVRLPV